MRLIDKQRKRFRIAFVKGFIFKTVKFDFIGISMIYLMWSPARKQYGDG